VTPPPLRFTLLQVMELADGGDLFDHCVNVNGNGPMPEKGLQLIVRQLLRGLSHAHQRDIVNLDLKLENILLQKPVTRDHWQEAEDSPDAAIQLKILYGVFSNQIDAKQWRGIAPGTEGYRFARSFVRRTRLC
jgi:serine/threonine protein kinase